MGVTGSSVVVVFTVLASGSYVAWLFVFERWVEPFLRRCGGALLGCRVVWVPAVGAFRVWGTQDRRRPAVDAAVRLLGTLVVLCSAFLPAVALRLTAGSEGGDPRMAAWSYLVSLVMMALFIVRVLTGRLAAQ